MRLIDADKLMIEFEVAQKAADQHGREFTNCFYDAGGEISTNWFCVEDMVDNAPTVDAVPVKHGRWIKVNGKTAINCSACYHCSWSRSFEDTVKRFNFCPNCGADMKKDGDGDETD